MAYREKADSSSETDEEDALDFTGPLFDPTRALYSKNTVVPYPSAIRLDNIATYESRMKAGDLTKAVGNVGKLVALKNQEKKEKLEAKNSNRFLPHQMPIPSTRIIKLKNLFTMMDTYTGPLASIYKMMQERIRAKIVTRNERGIRGYCVGFIQAFDKHWNLALSDVTEVWTRRKKKKIPVAIQDHVAEVQSNPPIRAPPVLVKCSGRGIETCERHVPQLVMRGEHVVLVLHYHPVPSMPFALKHRPKKMDPISVEDD